MRIIHGKEVFGSAIDDETRCEHWHSPLDIIAIKFKCCGRWYPCFDCHAAEADHAAQAWAEDERDTPAILCGGCGAELSIKEYLACGNVCPDCGRDFNPGCAKHYHLYFA